MNNMNPSYFEWAGAITGLIGAALLSVNMPISRFGWVMFLVSNCFLLCFAYLSKLDGVFILQIGFMLTSILGIVRSFKRDPSVINTNLGESHPSRIFAK